MWRAGQGRVHARREPGMPRPKLSSLSSLMPAKGEASRPEPIARAPEPPAEPEIMQDGMQAGEHDRIQASKPPSTQTSQLAGHKDGSRSAVSFRMTESLQERLRLYAFETRRSKQDILDDALHEYLVRVGR